MKKEFSDSELLVLGLIAEMPRHGYELEAVIDKRSMREWTRIGFSSIYYTLGKLEKKGLIQSEKQMGPKSRKRYDLTDKGREVLIEATLSALKIVEPTYPSLLLGMIHLSSLTRDQVLDAFVSRKDGLAAEIERMKNIHFDQQPQPDYVDAVFEYSLGQLQAEKDWIDRTLAYLETKAWLG